MKNRVDLFSFLPKNLKSMDRLNRQVIPKKKLHNIPEPKVYSNANLFEAITYVKKHFPDSPGPEWKTIQWIFPTTHADAKRAAVNFIKVRLRDFGKYQDYIYFGDNTQNPTLYHSNLSSSLNIGLINPIDLIKGISKGMGAPMNSVEGFIRQLFWREYQLYCFKYVFGRNCADVRPFYRPVKKITANWYRGSLGVVPVDVCIKKAFRVGYLHHIERLMVVGNYMLLSGIDPRDGFKWFMEFSVDSYEWVMCQNVYEMVFNTKNKKTMRRIYISSSNYILKMSNAERGSWIEKWDALYTAFLKKNKRKIGYPYE